MTDEIVNKLKNNVTMLMERYESLLVENQNMANENEQLKKHIETLKSEKQAIKEQYDILKVAKTLASNGNDVGLTKNKINNIVREIDQCIALLNR